MMRSLYTASSGMYAQQLNVDTLAHNMSNVNTVGFKKQRLEFQDLLYQTIKRPTSTEATNEPVGLSVGLGVKPAAIATLFSQGNMQNTENPLDVAINGQGFFNITVEGYEEPLYSKDGAFKIDAAGNLVTADGNKVTGATPVAAGAYDVKIDNKGLVTYMVPGQTEPQEAGTIQISKFMNPMGLTKLGNNLYQVTPNSGEAVACDLATDKSISLAPGYLEMANVQIVEEMVSLITAQRAYDINSKVVQASDEMLQTAAALRR